jgi:branched-chain amino acid aminotransferase
MTSAPNPGSGIAFIDGRFCPIEEAKISVIDMAVTKGDSTYDVVHVWNGRFYRLDDHLDRFHTNMKALRLDPGLDRREIENALHECVSRAGLRAAYVSMTCTRGRTMVQGSRDLRTARNGFYAYAVPLCGSVPSSSRRAEHRCGSVHVREFLPRA